MVKLSNTAVEYLEKLTEYHLIDNRIELLSLRLQKYGYNQRWLDEITKLREMKQSEKR